MPKRDIIVIGASAGGWEALSELFQTLPKNLPASIFIVWHLPSSGTGLLPAMIHRKSGWLAENATDGAPIEHGRIYVAPIDHHLLIDQGQMRVTKGPKENRFRPAIDPLFRSAAYTYGPRVVGIILSGALNDGTSGLWTVRDQGGIAIVQDPEDALVNSMPLSALENVDIDYAVPVSEMAPLLVRLTNETVPSLSYHPNSERLETEVKFAKNENMTETQLGQFGKVSEFTCPECHGTLWQLAEGITLRFRCRTGHAYTAEALLEDMAQSVEAMEWAVIRGIEENATLMEHMAKHLVQKGSSEQAQSFVALAQRSRERAELVRQAILRDDIPQVEPGAGTAPV